MSDSFEIRFADDNEKYIFEKLANTLIDHTFICSRSWDQSKGRTVNNQPYFYARKLFPKLRDYFSCIGWILELNEIYGVVMLRRSLPANQKLNRYTTLFIYTCRLFYEEAVQNGAAVDAVACSEQLIHEKMNALGVLPNGRPTAADRKETLKYMEDHLLIARRKDRAWNPKESNEFIIMAPLAMLLDPMTIRETSRIVDLFAASFSNGEITGDLDAS